METLRFSNSKRKSTGAHYTPPALARFVAREIASVLPSSCPRVLDPAVGNGELLVALLQELAREVLVTGFDTDALAVAKASERLRELTPNLSITQRDFLAAALEHRESELMPTTVDKFDVVIANPPYVRTQVMGADAAQRISRQFDLTGRVDLYFAFIEGIAAVLREGGVAGIIVSNRFMTTRAGARVRQRIHENFEVLHVWDLGDTRLFEAAVLPAVLLLRKGNTQPNHGKPFSSIYTTREEARRTASDIFDALHSHGPIRVNDEVFKVVHGSLNAGNGHDVWRVSTPTSIAWLETVRRHTSQTFGDIGKIRVGVKTTADRVFVRRDWSDLPPQEQPEVLRPLVTHEVARRYRARPTDRKILYTHEQRNGRKVAIDLKQYPRAALYLEKHRATLENRTYVTASGRQWFEIWVPQQPLLWTRPKLVFPDIAETPTFWMSLNDEVIQGDCYWLAMEDDSKIDLLWLALAVGNSSFIADFYDQVCVNRLYAGRRRFMTQYVEQFPLPDPRAAISGQIIGKTKEIYDSTPSERATQLALELDHDVREAFGVEEAPRQRQLEFCV